MTLVLGSAFSSISATSHFVTKTFLKGSGCDPAMFILEEDKDFRLHGFLSGGFGGVVRLCITVTDEQKKCGNFIEVWGKLLAGLPNPVEEENEQGTHQFVTSYRTHYIDISSTVTFSGCQLPSEIPHTLYLWYRKFKQAVPVPFQSAYVKSTEVVSQSSCGNHLGSLLDLEDPPNWDVTIVSESGRKWKLHKCILRTRSPVFAAMFAHDMKENIDGVINIKETDGGALEAMIRFIYTDDLDHLPLDSLKNSLALADRFQIPVLKKKCGKMLSKMLNKENALEFCFMAGRYNECFLRKEAARLVAMNFSEICCNDDWIELIKKEPQIANEVVIFKCSE